jgi:DnaJ-class molecular chaperone
MTIWRTFFPDDYNKRGCFRCKGEGKVTVVCRVCQGTGIFKKRTSRGWIEETCRKCEGKKTFESVCPKCGGSRYYK